MKLLDVITRVKITEANVAAKILKDPKMTKMLSIAWKHDHTLPPGVVARLGPNPTEQSIVQAWSKLLDDTLRNNNYGDLSADGKFDDWLTRLYINGQADYEDINGEGGDALGAWKALSIRGLLRPADQDFNKFTSIKKLQRLRNDREYATHLDKIKNAEREEKLKRGKSDTVLIDNDRYYVIAPFNYGACHVFGNVLPGFKPNFCTSSSSGARWFENYAPRGMIVSIFDKSNPDDKDGKWQFHAVTDQLVNGLQDDRHNLRKNDEKFSKLFPGLMKQIADAILANAEEIKEKSKDFISGGYDANTEVSEIKQKFPLSYASGQEEKTDGEEPANNENGPGRYRVTMLSNNRSAVIQAENREDLINQIIERSPALTREQLLDPEQFTIDKLPNEEPAGV
jgi:hypothetical protein